MRRLAVALLVAGLAVIVLGIARGGASPETELSYELAWEWGDARPVDGGWSVTTDAGHDVVVTGGELTTYSATVVECPHSHSIWSRVTGVFGSVAAAGHGEDGEEQVTAVVVQSLADPTTATLGSSLGHEQSYCEGHTAFGNEDGGTTMWIEGTADGVPFRIETADAWGAKAELTADFDGGDPTTIVVSRDLGALLDDVAFDTMTPDEQGRAMLRSLAAHTAFAALSS